MCRGICDSGDVFIRSLGTGIETGSGDRSIGTLVHLDYQPRLTHAPSWVTLRAYGL